MSEPLTLYKLIILYMLEKVDFPLTNAQISGFVLDKGYTTYFHLQQAISELIDSELIESKTIRNSSYFEITAQVNRHCPTLRIRFPMGLNLIFLLSSKKILFRCEKNYLLLQIITKVKSKVITYAVV